MIFFKSFLVLIPPVIQFFLFRFLFKFYGIQIGWRSATDFHFFVPVISAFLVATYVLTLEGVPKLKWRSQMIVPNLLCLVFVLVWVWSFKNYLTPSHSLPRIVFFISTGLTLGTACFYFLNPRFVFQNSKRWVLAPVLAIALSHYFFQNNSPYLWEQMAPVMVAALQAPAEWLVGPLRMEVIQLHTTLSDLSIPNSTIVMSSKKFAVLIGLGCSGLEGLYLFSICFFILTQLMDGTPRILNLLFLFILGLLVTWLLNLGRILFLYRLGVALASSPWNAKSSVLFLYHSHVGWFINLIWIWAYSTLLLRHSPRPTSSPARWLPSFSAVARR